MRIGDNPRRDKLVDTGNYLHQVIMPIYIPSLDSYYLDSFKVFKISLSSLIKTVNKQTFITVIANGCCQQVEDFIIELYKEKKIHELIITDAIGKVNSILKALSGSLFPVVTITDADVLFLNNWQSATYCVFNNFPKAAVVSPVPNPALSFLKNANLFYTNIFNKNLVFDKVKNPEALKKFAISINALASFKQHFEKTLSIKNNSFIAVVGAGHFVATYKTDIFNYNFTRFTEYALGGDSEAALLDQKATNLGLWRLSTQDNFAFHMGNTLENWHLDYFNKIQEENQLIAIFPDTTIKPISKIQTYKLKLINKLFTRIKVKKALIKIIEKRSTI